MKPLARCPHCGNPLTCSSCGETLRTEEAIKLAIARGYKYCQQCGKEIASTLSEALTKSAG